MIYYVYVILDPRKPGKYEYDDLVFEYEPFYVGRGKGNRIKTTLYEGNDYKIKKIKKIQKENIIILKLYDKISFDESNIYEIKTISKIGRCDINTGPLLNFTGGGEGMRDYSHSKMTIEKLKKEKRKYFNDGNSTWNKNRSWTLEERKKLTNKSNSGKTFTEEHKKKMSENAKNQLKNGNSVAKLPRIVLQFTLDGEFIKEYESIKSANVETNIPRSSIRSCCVKILKHAGGFYWEYKKCMEFYFAYGSNMSKNRMFERKIIYDQAIPAKLENYELRFNKVSKKQGAVANVVPKSGSVVEGVLYNVDNLELLDIAEGYPKHYDRVLLKINEDVEAWVYIANNEFIKEGLIPSKEYLKFLLDGKNFLSEDYVNKLILIYE